MASPSPQLVLVTGANREWGISDQWFALGDSLVVTVLGQIAFMPILVLASRLCPEGVEATLFAALMSVFNAGAVVSGALGGGLMTALGITAHDFDRLPVLIVLCNLSSLLVRGIELFVSSIGFSGAFPTRPSIELLLFPLCFFSLSLCPSCTSSLGHCRRRATVRLQSSCCSCRPRPGKRRPRTRASCPI